jgi:anaerobic selenocysteine-containing dehydrogenase
MTANEVAPRRRTCPLCEAMCGVTLEVSGDRVLAVRGDPEDAFSRGYICPKAVGLMDVHHDPDRLGQPLRRRNGTWERVGWDDAVAETVKRLADIRRAHGDDAVAFYVGNPATHSYSATLAALAFARALNTRNVFSTASVDYLPHTLEAPATYRLAMPAWLCSSISSGQGQPCSTASRKRCSDPTPGFPPQGNTIRSAQPMPMSWS